MPELKNIKTNIKCNNKNEEFTEEDLIKFLQTFYKESGKIPTRKDFTYNINYPDSNKYLKKFGSWNISLSKAGFIIKERIKYHMSNNNELLNYMKKFYEEKGKCPTESDFKADQKYPNFKTYAKRFGSWNEALKMAGLSIYKNTDNELLSLLKEFYLENNKIPTCEDFNNNSRYPHSNTYINRFNSWNNALKLAELNIDTMIKNKTLKISSSSRTQHKGRMWELYILKSFKEDGAIDLSGQNCNNPFDGICPKGITYDAKSSKLLKSNWKWEGWHFEIENKNISETKIIYLGAFDENYDKLLHSWRISNIFLNGRKSVYIGKYSGEYNINNMKNYEITNSCVDFKIIENVETTNLLNEVKSDKIVESKEVKKQKSISDYV